MTEHRAELWVPTDHAVFAGHFPGRPLVPGAMLLDRVISAAQRGRSQFAARVTQVKFVSSLLPNQRAEIVWSDDGQTVRFRCEADGVLVAEGVFTWRRPLEPA
jgi:3-hydroxyacyl-[acyl-carrier-protein] dehydratase